MLRINRKNDIENGPICWKSGNISDFRDVSSRRGISLDSVNENVDFQ